MPTNCLGVFDHFMELALKGLISILRLRLILLNIKMSAKSKKNELSEEFTAMWREEQSLWDVMSPLY